MLGKNSQITHYIIKLTAKLHNFSQNTNNFTLFFSIIYEIIRKNTFIGYRL